MNATDRDARIRALFEEDLELLQRKGHDYSGDVDSLRNFRDFGWFGILVRLSDKISRLKNLAKNNDPRVGDESLIDTLRDIRNYAYLMQVVYEEGGDDSIEQKGWECPHCHRLLNDDWISCPYCERRVTKPATGQKEKGWECAHCDTHFLGELQPLKSFDGHHVCFACLSKEKEALKEEKDEKATP